VRNIFIHEIFYKKELAHLQENLDHNDCCKFSLHLDLLEAMWRYIHKIQYVRNILLLRSHEDCLMSEPGIGIRVQFLDRPATTPSSNPHSSLPRSIMKKPSKPQEEFHELATSQ